MPVHTHVHAHVHINAHVQVMLLTVLSNFAFAHMDSAPACVVGLCAAVFLAGVQDAGRHHVRALLWSQLFSVCLLLPFAYFVGELSDFWSTT